MVLDQQLFAMAQYIQFIQAMLNIMDFLGKNWIVWMYFVVTISNQMNDN